jgi:hypothetical protein
MKLYFFRYPVRKYFPKMNVGGCFEGFVFISAPNTKTAKEILKETHPRFFDYYDELELDVVIEELHPVNSPCLRLSAYA